jgi:hypothetical protein
MSASFDQIRDQKLAQMRDPADHRSHLMVAAGYLTGAGYAGSAAAALLALDQLYPGHDLSLPGMPQPSPSDGVDIDIGPDTPRAAKVAVCADDGGKVYLTLHRPDLSVMVAISMTPEAAEGLNLDIASESQRARRARAARAS